MSTADITQADVGALSYVSRRDGIILAAIIFLPGAMAFTRTTSDASVDTEAS